jgi:gliding motility-associated-like protein
MLSEYCPFYIWVPNVFTPDGDTYNETFYAVGSGSGLKDFRLIILNRWGNLMFESNLISEEWDGSTQTGKMAQDGVYIYVLNYSYYNNDGAVISEKKVGHVTLLR